MRKKEILEEYKKKLKEYEKYNKAYYDKNNPLVSDSKFDELKESIIKLEKKYDYLESQNSPSKVVGFKPSKNFKNFLTKFLCYLWLMLLMKKI